MIVASSPPRFLLGARRAEGLSLEPAFPRQAHLICGGLRRTLCPAGVQQRCLHLQQGRRQPMHAAPVIPLANAGSTAFTARAACSASARAVTLCIVCCAAPRPCALQSTPSQTGSSDHAHPARPCRWRSVSGDTLAVRLSGAVRLLTHNPAARNIPMSKDASMPTGLMRRQRSMRVRAAAGLGLHVASLPSRSASRK